MQSFLISKQSKYNFLIPTLLLIGSFSLYSFNLIDQPSHGDEILYLAYGGVFFHFLSEGDFDNPCLKNLKDCELLYSSKKISEITYTAAKNFFDGLGPYLITGENKGDFKEWSCKWSSCWDNEFWPSKEEFVAGRFFAPIFGSLTIVIAFFIGKILFNRTTGLFFSLTLLFYSLWLVNSRMMFSEVYLHFFLLLSIILLLKSFKKENNHRVLFFIFSAMSFGIATNVKLFTVELVIPILVMILFYDSFNEKLNFRFFKNRKNVLKIISLVLIFFLVSSIIFVSTFPRYYDNTFDQILSLKDQTGNWHFASFPTAEKNYLYRTLVTLQIILIPHLMDSNVHDFFPDEVKKMSIKISKGQPLNYSTIPLSLFFFIGLIYMINKIKNRNLKFSEFVLLVWFTCLFVFITLFVDNPGMERYYLPVMFPVMLIASYALWNFMKQIQNQKEKILFFTSFIVAHSLYIISFFDKIYFTSGRWGNPLPVSSQDSLNEPLVYVSSIIFVIIFVIVFLRTKKYYVKGRLLNK